MTTDSKQPLTIRLTITKPKGKEMWNPSSPAKHQKSSSSVMNSKTPFKLGKIPSNTQQLWWFQIAHAPRMIMDLRPLWTWPSTLSFVLAHQSSKEKSSCWGVKSWKPTFCKRIYHTCQANTHETSKWSIVSPAWSHSTQRSWILNYHFDIVIALLLISK